MDKGLRRLAFIMPTVVLILTVVAVQTKSVAVIVALGVICLFYSIIIMMSAYVTMKKEEKEKDAELD